MPPSPMIGSIMIPAVVVADGSLNGADVAGSDMVEAVDGRAEALEMLGLAAGRDGGERPAVEGALEGDEAVALRRALR